MGVKYSLVIPHHNNPGLLERLLSTVPTRNDLEVIVADDGSNDMSREGIKRLSKKYPRVLFIENKICGGGGKARNIGISHANGEYILFADSDDFFLPSLNELLDRCSDVQQDIIFFNAISTDSNNYKICKRAQHLNGFIRVYKKDSKKGLLSLRYLFGEPWCKIIKRELIIENNIRFEEVPIHNDTLFSYMVGHCAKSYRVEDLCVYCVTESSNSVSKSTPDNKLFIRARIFLQKNLFLQFYNIPVMDRKFLSSYWEYIKRFKFKEIIMLNKELSLSWIKFGKLTTKIIYKELTNNLFYL